MPIGDGQVMGRIRSFLTEPTFGNVAGMTPEDVARRRALAQALWSEGNNSEPVTSIFGGMNKMLQSLLGGRQLWKAENTDIAVRDRERTAAEAEAARLEQQQTDAIRQMNNFANPAQPAPMAPADTILPATTFNAGTQNEWSAGDFPGGGTVPRGPQITYNYGDSTIRNQPINGNLENVLKAAADAAGVSGIVIGSGGQPSAAEGGNRTGSTRHDDGGAADLQLIGPDGRVLDFTNPADLPIIQAFVSHARANGATGIGAGTDYMGNNTLHVGFGAEGVWGAGGQGASAPEWLTTAFNAMVPGTNAMRNFVDTAASNPVLRPFVAELLQGQITALMTPPEPAPGFRDLTDPAERAARGIAADDTRVYQVGPDNQLHVTAPSAAGATAANLRTEIRQLQSYKNYSRSMPIYQSMLEAAGDNDRIADLNLVYGLATIFDPDSVVREGEQIMIRNAASLPEQVQGWIAAVNGEAGLGPELRAAVLEQAYSRVNAYANDYRNQLSFFGDVAGRAGIAIEDLYAPLEELQRWSPPAAAGAAAGGTPPAGWTAEEWNALTPEEQATIQR